MPAHKPLILSPVNTLLQASTVGAMLVLIWVSSSGWTTTQTRMAALETNQTASNVAISELAKAVQSLAVTTGELQKQLGEVFRDRWTGTDMAFWVLKAKSANPAVNWPDVERVLPPAVSSGAPVLEPSK